MAEYRYHAPEVLDVEGVQQVRAELIAIVAERDCDLLVDCSATRFIDSVGLTLLLECNTRLQAKGRNMLVTNLRQGPRRVFDIAGLTELMRYDRTVPMAGTGLDTG